MRTILFIILSLSFIGISNAQSKDSISIALGLIDLSFDRIELDSMKQDIHEQKESFKLIRKETLPNDLAYSLVFMPPLNTAKISEKQKTINWGINEEVMLPENIDDLAFFPVYKLASLIKSQKISSTELTQLFLKRLRTYGDTLKCVITITDSLAFVQAKKADEELKQGIYRGPLHGIPYGVKDLLAVAGYKTTWGAMPYKNQYLNYDATVVKNLEKAGAVLVAKLTLGELAWGDVWYGGVTKNPWNLLEGSQGSSSGPASATVAGLVPFSIGSETWGSIVVPSTRCGATGLRTTFGRVSRHGSMALSWSADKLGPICRNAIDCALVLEAMQGEDNLDLSVRSFPFNYDHNKDVKTLRVGILYDEFRPGQFNFKNDSITIELLKSKGFDLIQKQLPSDIPIKALSFIISAEAGAAFDELTRSNRDTLLARQVRNGRPNVFRASRAIPAVEYIQANRLRYRLTLQFNEMMKDIDVLVVPSFNNNQLLMTNLTGHPCVVLPNGSYEGEHPGTISLIGNHFDEASILLFARYLQKITNFDDEHPPFFQSE